MSVQEIHFLEQTKRMVKEKGEDAIDMIWKILADIILLLQSKS